MDVSMESDAVKQRREKSEIRNPKSKTNSNGANGENRRGNFSASCERFGLMPCRANPVEPEPRRRIREFRECSLIGKGAGSELNRSRGGSEARRRCMASVEMGRARHSVRAETGLWDERRARSDAPYLGCDPLPAMAVRSVRGLTFFQCKMCVVC
jgi:hypothetical protein